MWLPVLLPDRTAAVPRYRVVEGTVIVYIATSENGRSTGTAQGRVHKLQNMIGLSAETQVTSCIHSKTNVIQGA